MLALQQYVSAADSCHREDQGRSDQLDEGALVKAGLGVDLSGDFEALCLFPI